MDITKPYFGSDKIRKEVREEFIRRHPDINPDDYYFINFCQSCKNEGKEEVCMECVHPDEYSDTIPPLYYHVRKPKR